MSWTDASSRQEKSLFVSAGHSDTDPGAKGNGYSEADLVLSFRDKVVLKLVDMGVKASTDGMNGENLPLRQAARMAEEHDLAVEFHFNAFRSASARGTEVLSNQEDKRFAEVLSKEVSKVLSTDNRGAKAEDSGQHSRLAFIQAGGLILEIGFITSPHDVESFKNREDKVAQVVADCLADEVLRG